MLRPTRRHSRWVPRRPCAAATLRRRYAPTLRVRAAPRRRRRANAGSVSVARYSCGKPIRQPFAGRCGLRTTVVAVHRAGRVLRVISRHRVEQRARCRRRSAPSARLDRGSTRTRPCRSAIRDPYVGFSPQMPLKRGRLADRSAGVGTGCRRCQSRGDRGSRTARRTAGHARRIPRIAHGAVVARFARRAHRELVHVGLAEHHRAGRVEARDDGCVVRRDEVVEHLRTAARTDAARAEDVLVRDRQTGQRRRPFRSRSVASAAAACASARSARHRDEAVVARVEPFDPIEIEARQLDAGELPALSPSCQVSEGGERIHHSTTRGTRYRPSRTAGAICWNSSRSTRSVTSSARRRCVASSGWASGSTSSRWARGERVDHRDDARRDRRARVDVRRDREPSAPKCRACRCRARGSS